MIITDDLTLWGTALSLVRDFALVVSFSEKKDKKHEAYLALINHYCAKIGGEFGF